MYQCFMHTSGGYAQKIMLQKTHIPKIKEKKKRAHTVYNNLTQIKKSSETNGNTEQNDGFLNRGNVLDLCLHLSFTQLKFVALWRAHMRHRATHVTLTSGKRIMRMTTGFLRQCCQATVLGNRRRNWLTSINTVSCVFIHCLSYNTENAFKSKAKY